MIEEREFYFFGSRHRHSKIRSKTTNKQDKTAYMQRKTYSSSLNIRSCFSATFLLLCSHPS
jgi:hypothetical protein